MSDSAADSPLDFLNSTRKFLPGDPLEAADVITERANPLKYHRAKFRKIRRDRQFMLVKYWTVWAIGGSLLVLLLAAAVFGLNAGG